MSSSSSSTLLTTGPDQAMETLLQDDFQNQLAQETQTTTVHHNQSSCPTSTIVTSTTHKVSVEKDKNKKQKPKKKPEVVSEKFFDTFVRKVAWRYAKYFSISEDTKADPNGLWGKYGKTYFSEHYFKGKGITDAKQQEEWWIEHSPYMLDKFRSKRSNVLASMRKAFISKCQSKSECVGSSRRLLTKRCEIICCGI